MAQMGILGYRLEVRQSPGERERAGVPSADAAQLLTPRLPCVLWSVSSGQMETEKHGAGSGSYRTAVTSVI